VGGRLHIPELQVFTPVFSPDVPCEVTLQDQIDALTKQLDDLKKQIQPKPSACDKSEPWNPKGGKFVVMGSGSVAESCDPISCKGYIKHGRAFTTVQSADKALKYYEFIQRLYCLALELNEGSEPDWGNGLDYKYIVIYDHQFEQYDFESRVKSNFFVPAFKDKETVLKAIDILNKEPKYWEGEE